MALMWYGNYLAISGLAQAAVPAFIRACLVTMLFGEDERDGEKCIVW